ncbi:MAG: glycosyltransferase family 2 protein, partial [Cyclobacteriaceae bacterium]
MTPVVKYSIIIPVFNRPHEVDELLLSLTHQTYGNFEVLIVEDGSSETCESVYERYTQHLQIRYFFKPNSGPGPSRNFGYQHAQGDYFIVFDSDCIIPPEYLSVVDKSLQDNPLDAWGGPDRGHKDFTSLQQAMAFTMSSVVTTGGIRGGGKANLSFQPRSFNMGISKEVFSKTGGFKFDRFAEDIEFSIRIKKAGFRIGLIPDAYVFHKRRTSLQQFYRQVFNFGRGRVLVGRAHSDAIKITHWFPALFSLGLLFMLPMLLFWPIIGLLLGTGYVI